MKTLKEFKKEVSEDINRINRVWKGTNTPYESDNIFTEVTINDSEFRQLIIELILGKDWYVTDPLNGGQVNTIALVEIIQKYNRKRSFLEKFLDLFYKSLAIH